MKKKPARSKGADQSAKKPKKVKRKNKPDSLDRLAGLVKRILSVPTSGIKKK